jgi:hypothetical protein
LIVLVAGRELNPRHADFQSAALPTELPGRCEPRIRQARRKLVNYSLKINHLQDYSSVEKSDICKLPVHKRSIDDSVAAKGFAIPRSSKIRVPPTLYIEEKKDRLSALDESAHASRTALPTKYGDEISNSCWPRLGRIHLVGGVKFRRESILQNS